MAIEAVGGAFSKVPIKILFRLLTENHAEETIRAMDFQFLKMHYDRLSTYSANELLKTINNPDMADSTSNWV